ncbi:MAG: hypothetical protein ACFFEU_13245 [Candidatus Thorarchaeota archaeon]
MTSFVLIPTVIAAVPYASYDFPSQVLYDGFMQEGFWTYHLWVDEDRWVAIEISADVPVGIDVSYYVASQNTHYEVSTWTGYNRIVTLKPDSYGAEFSITLDPVSDGNVTVEIIDSSQSVANNIPGLLSSPWFLLLLFPTTVLDAYWTFKWLRVYGTKRSRQSDEIVPQPSAEELKFSRRFLVISKLRGMKDMLTRKRKRS